MILMGDGSTEERHKPITEELIDRPLVAMDLVECYLKKAIEERVHCLRSDTLRNGSGVCQVTEQHRHLFPFAFQSTPGGQNLLGKVSRSIGQRLSFMCGGWSRGKCWGARDWGLRLG